MWLWVLLFVVIALGGLGVLGYVLLRLWRSARRLLEELDVMAGRAGQLADLLAQIEVAPTGPAGRPSSGFGSELAPDDGWPSTVETYDDAGATAPGKKEP